MLLFYDNMYCICRLCVIYIVSTNVMSAVHTTHLSDVKMLNLLINNKMRLVLK